MAWERLAYVFQSPRLLPWKDTLDNAAFGLEMRRPELPRSERRECAAGQLHRVGLGEIRCSDPDMIADQFAAVIPMPMRLKLLFAVTAFPDWEEVDRYIHCAIDLFVAGLSCNRP